MDYLSFSFFLFATFTFSIMNVYYFHSKNKVKLLEKFDITFYSFSPEANIL